MKPIRIPIWYPCIICSSVDHWTLDCLKKIKVQNMFRIEHVSSTTTTTPKPFKIDNVLVNVVTTITTYGRQLEQV
jgi:hypothetical protein